MSSRTASPSSHAYPAAEPRQRYNHIIDHQLTRTRRRLKLVDLGVMAMTLLGAVILYTLLLVLIDHWVIGLSAATRALALGILLLGIGYHGVRRLVPLAVRPINPCYAARTIEQSDASLKNSVINFLMCRRESTPTGRLIYRALQQRAALDLRQVNLDLAVDRSRLIHVGYLVVALMVLFAAYTIFSPKDVFQTVKRVSAPWANLARPTRVTIDDLQPGHAEVIRGGQVEVSAKVFGAGPDDVVKLLYTTEDRQTVDRGLPMQPPETGQYYTCTLPENSQGLQQSVKYRVEAGDASSSEYQLTMMHVPSIVVDKIEYRYPDYMNRPPGESEGKGEIRAVEGTSVTVHAKANHEIQRARIEFDPDVPSAMTTHKMNSEGTRATYTFPLLWDDAENAPEHAAYRLAFTPKLATDPAHDIENQPSAKHGIRVTPDLPPEISILTPSGRNVDVPVNGRQRIEIRAIDPDYGLTEIRVRARVDGEACLDEAFPQEGENGRTGQVVVEYQFRPRELNLQPGDCVTLWGEAADNRTEPNIGKTRDTILNIVPPDRDSNGEETDQGSTDQDTDQEKDADAGRSEPDSAHQKSPSDSTSSQSKSESESSQTGDNSSQNDQGESGEEQSGQAQSEPGEKNNAEDSASESANEEGKGESEQESTGQPQPAQQGEQTEGEQSGEGGQQESGASGNDGGDQESGDQNGTGASAGGSSGSEEGAGSPAGNASQQADAGESDSSEKPSGGSDDAGSGETGTAENQTDGGSRGRKEQENRPSHDGEAFEQLLEYLKGQGGGEHLNGERQVSGPSPATEKPSSPEAASDLRDEGSNSQAGGDSEGVGENQSLLEKPNEAQASRKQTGPSRSRDAQGGQDSSVSEDRLDHGGGESEENSGAGEEADAEGNADGSRQEQQSEAAGKPEAAASSNQESSGDGQGEATGAKPPLNKPDGSRQGRKSPPEHTSAKHDPEGSAGDDTQSLDQDAARSGTEGGGEDETGGKSESENDSKAGDVGGRDLAEQEESGSGESDPGKISQKNNGDSQSSGDGEQDGGNPSPRGPDGGPREKQPANTENRPQNRTPSNDAQTPGQRDRQETGKGGLEEGTASGNSGGGGLPAESAAMPNDAQRKIAEADEANTEYAEAATDLVLEHLKDQQQDPNPELLDSLGWSSEELREFVARWETMKRKAGEQGGKARQELQDALRSLGLRPDQPERRAMEVENDAFRGMRDGGNRSQPPREVLDQFKAYKKGMARGQRE